MVVLLSEATARVGASVGVSASERQAQAGPVAITTPDGVVLQGIYRDGGARSDVGLLLVHGLMVTGEMFEPVIDGLCLTTTDRSTPCLRIGF